MKTKMKNVEIMIPTLTVFVNQLERLGNLNAADKMSQLIEVFQLSNLESDYDKAFTFGLDTMTATLVASQK